MISYLEKCAFSKHFLEAFRANQVTDHDRSTVTLDTTEGIRSVL